MLNLNRTTQDIVWTRVKCIAQFENLPSEKWYKWFKWLRPLSRLRFRASGKWSVSGTSGLARPSCPAPWGPLPRAHGPAGQAQGSRTRAREQAQGCGVGAGQQQPVQTMAPDILSYGRTRRAIGPHRPPVTARYLHPCAVALPSAPDRPAPSRRLPGALPDCPACTRGCPAAAALAAHPAPQPAAARCPPAPARLPSVPPATGRKPGSGDRDSSPPYTTCPVRKFYQKIIQAVFVLGPPPAENTPPK
jgi:hypothetical protein